ncbi:response regulator transcription factor [Scatolibacter rhodanostii]|uniref:response regulator transcription factor n=1 Tax=Scatolibacter rhodanostii TaxID=2014781 RepID=UPI000C07EFF4|nr:response regulator transcription factor [Scatolibacter rhodanostii]
MAKILVAEDEEKINELICKNLQLVGHKVESALNGEIALSLIENNDYDLALLDVMMPGLSGFEIAQKKQKDVPIIFVTAKDGLSSRLSGLNLGADDYITKPFEILELIARVKAVLRRTHKQETSFQLGDVLVEFDVHRVRKNGEDITLTPKEFELLETLVVNRNLALSRDKLLDLIWGYDFDGDIRTVDVHIQRLRSKLELKNEIATVYKLGYRLNA